MKYSILTLALVIITSFSSGNFGQPSDTIPSSVKIKAMQKTDNEIDRLLHRPTPPVTTIEINKWFNKVLSHMDSINAMAIMREKQAEVAAITRDSIRHALVMQKLENKVLVEENTQLNKEKSIVFTTIHVIAIFLAMVAAIQVSKGVDLGLKEIQKLKNENR